MTKCECGLHEKALFKFYDGRRWQYTCDGHTAAFAAKVFRQPDDPGPGLDEAGIPTHLSAAARKARVIFWLAIALALLAAALLV